MSPTGEQLKYIVQMIFGEGQATNNTTEYEGLLAGLGIKRLVVRGDSQLVINQVTKDYEFPQMAAYVDEVRKLERRFDGLQMEHVPRTMNGVADQLSKLATKREPAPPGTFIERLTRPSIMPAKPKAQVTPCPGKEVPPASSLGDPVSGDPGKETLPDKHKVMAMVSAP
jgi:ribonuclease HI